VTESGEYLFKYMPRGTKREDKGKRLFFLYPVDFSAEGKGTASVRGKPPGFSPKEREYF